MDKKREAVKRAILFRVMGIPLSSTQEALLEDWSAKSQYQQGSRRQFC